MAILLTLLVTIVLTISFVVLTVYETEHQIRFFAEKRIWLDAQIERIAFIIAHVDFAAFLYDEVRYLVRQSGHTIVHLSLQLVRAVERLLTRVVRSFRVREASVAPRETAREFVKTLTDFKEQLKATTPEIQEIQ